MAFNMGPSKTTNYMLPQAMLMAPVIFMLCAAVPVMAAGETSGQGRYDIIIKKDPFNPDRGYGAEAGDGGLTSDKGIGERYQVYGTITVGGKKRAFIKLRSASGTGFKKPKGATMPSTEFRTVSIGDLVDGWKVADITHRGIILESENERIFVGVFESPKGERKAGGPVNFFSPPTRPMPVFSKPGLVRPARSGIRKLPSPQGPRSPRTYKGNVNATGLKPVAPHRIK